MIDKLKWTRISWIKSKLDGQLRSLKIHPSNFDFYLKELQ